LDQHDAYAVCAWIRDADRELALEAALNPTLSEAERSIARVEGWIVGVV
jgi:hypothetical protein